LRYNLRNVHLSLGEHDKSLEHLRAAEPLAEALSDQRRLGRVLGYLSTHFFLAADYDRALGPGERALAIARALDDLSFQAEMNQRLAFVYLVKGEYRRAVELTRWNITALTDNLARQAWTGPNLTAVISRAWLARCLSEQGAFAPALAYA